MTGVLGVTKGILVGERRKWGGEEEKGQRRGGKRERERGKESGGEGTGRGDGERAQRREYPLRIIR